MRVCWSSAFLVLVSLAASAASQPAGRPAPLFVAAEPEAALADPGIRPDDTTVLRQRLARIDDDILEAARRAAGRAGIASPTLRLNLFEDVLLGAVVDRTGPTSAGYWLSGQVEGSPLSSVTLVVNGDVVAGTVRTLAGTFSIRTAGNDGILAIREIDPSAQRLRDVVVDAHPSTVSQETNQGTDRVRPIRSPAHDAPGSRSGVAPVPGAAEDGSRIDVMVVYTPAAREEAGGDRAIRALINLWIADTNDAYLNSGVHQQMHLVWTAEVEYSGKPGDVRSPVDRLIHPSDGYLDEVHVLRDRYKADLVHLVLDNGFTQPDSICTGEAKPVRDPSSRDAAERTPFSSTTTGCDSVVFAHETGHSMGLRHDRYAEIHGCCGNLNMAYPYSHGYVNQRGFEAGAPASSRWYTIMTSNSQQCRDAGYSCERLLRFSNPDLTYNGDPMGVPGDEPSLSVDGPADARRSLNEARVFVANYRVADTTPSDRNWLVGGQRLLPGQFIQADAAACRLVFQTDGNLVAYKEGVAYWHAGTAGAATGWSAVMQSDGNFVVYDAGGVARWSTGTGGNPGAFLVIERDCNVVLLAARGAELWSSGRP